VKKWSQSSGIGGHNVPEWVVTMQRNRWTVSSGMSGHNAAEYAAIAHEKSFTAPFVCFPAILKANSNQYNTATSDFGKLTL